MSPDPIRSRSRAPSLGLRGRLAAGGAGAAALVGALDTIWLGVTATTELLDAVLVVGVVLTILAVTGRPRPAAEPVPGPRAPAPAPSTPPPVSPPQLPKWADPMVQPRGDGPIRPMVPRADGSSAFVRPLAPPGPISNSGAYASYPPRGRTDPAPTPRGTGASATGPHVGSVRDVSPDDILAELDRLEEELSHFQPLESAAALGTSEGAPQGELPDDLLLDP